MPARKKEEAAEDYKTAAEESKKAVEEAQPGEVDDVVRNQENPAGAVLQDRSVSNVVDGREMARTPVPELVDDTPKEVLLERAKKRQSEGVLKAEGGDLKGDRDTIEVVFVESGLTALNHVWKAGEVLKVVKGTAEYRSLQDSSDDAWIELSPEEQEARFGKVMFETQ